MRIDVTQEDIDSGLRYNSIQCPIARAMYRAGLTDVYVYRHRIRADDIEYRPDERVATFIFQFDGGLSVQPFSFILQPRED